MRPPERRYYGPIELGDVIADIKSDVHAERIHQNLKFRGEATTSGCHTVMEWQAILSEEMLEVVREINDAWWPSKLKSEAAAINRLRSELVQLAAVCFAMIERIDDGDAMLTYKGH